MEATIVEIMESWPLQLIIDVEGQRLHVQLSENVEVLESGRQVGVGALSPDRRIWVDVCAENKRNSEFLAEISIIKILN